MEGNFPNPKNEMCMKIQEAYRIRNRLYKKLLSPHDNQNTKYTE